MGTDIHLHFETQQPDGSWVSTFRPKPGQWWYEGVVDEKVKDGSAQTIFGEPDESTAYDLAYEHFKGIDISTPEGAREVIDRYSHHERFYYDFDIPGEDSYPRIGSRDYGWFSVIGDRIRSNGGMPMRGVPNDSCPEIKHQNKYYDGGDGHSHSWLGVSEMLNNMPSLRGYRQTKWMKIHIEDPNNTRMVFWFDN